MDLVLRDLLSGSVAGTATILIMTPLDTARTRLQVLNDPRLSGWDVLRAMRKEEGVRALYKGMMAPLCAQAVYKMVMFSTFGLTSRALERYDLSVGSFPVGFACGAFSGAINSFVVTPVELIRNRLAIQRGFVNLQYSGPAALISHIFASEGFRGMFRGIGATLLRDIPGVGAYFSVFHGVRHRLGTREDAKKIPRIMQVPIAGACAGITYWTIALPLDAVKTIVQTSDISLRQAMREVSWRTVYSTGYSMALARGIPGSAITFTTQTVVSKMIDDYWIRP